MKAHLLAGAAGLAAALTLSAPAQAATILDFSSACGGAASCEIGQDYGDTARVNISYRTVNIETGETIENVLRFAENGFGDLQGVAYGAGDEYYAEIVFDAADGYELSLASFDFAGLIARTRVTFELLTLDGTSLAEAAYRTAATHSSANFEEDYRGAVVLRWKPSDKVAVDNIAFDVRAIPVSGVPEPATWAMMIGGFGLAGAALRRRRQEVAA